MERNEIDDYKDKYVRLLAEFENYKKRVATEQERYREETKFKTATDLCTLNDNIDRASEFIESAKDNADVSTEAFTIISTMVKKFLSDRDITKFTPQKGDTFDPLSMHAIMTIPTDNEEEVGLISECYESGYKTSTKILKYPTVVVYKKRED